MNYYLDIEILGDRWEEEQRVLREEFERETEEDISEGLLFNRRDMDLPDEDWEDEDDEFVD